WKCRMPADESLQGDQTAGLITSRRCNTEEASAWRSWREAARHPPLLSVPAYDGAAPPLLLHVRASRNQDGILGAGSLQSQHAVLSTAEAEVPATSPGKSAARRQAIRDKRKTHARTKAAVVRPAYH